MIRLHHEQDLLGHALVTRVGAEFCDLGLISDDGRTVLAHSWVMARSSPLLSSLLREAPRCQCREVVRVTIAGVSGDTLDNIVSLIYSGDITLTQDAANELNENAKVLGIDNIVNIVKNPKQQETKPCIEKDDDFYMNDFDDDINHSDEDEDESEDEDEIGANNTVNSMDTPGEIPEVNDKIDRLMKLVASENATENKELDSLVSDIFMDSDEEEKPKFYRVTGERKLKWKGKRPKNHNLSKVCPKCGKDFSHTKGGRNLMLTHYREVHEGEGPHICPECGKSCPNLKKYKTHKRSAHGPVAHCDQCDFKCLQKSNLRIHKLYNHAERNIICDQCSMAFPLQSALDKHVRIVHEGIKLKCPDCDFQTSTKQNLKKHHDMIHLKLKFSCKICSKEYSNQSAVNVHALKEHGVNLKKYKKHNLGNGKTCFSKM